jgi:hypothetical protein
MKCKFYYCPMDKKAVMYVVAALVIIVILALVVKPMVNKQLSPNSTVTPTITPSSEIPSWVSGNAAAAQSTGVITPVLSPKPTPTRDLSVQAVGFVDPSTYHLTMNETIPQGRRIDQIPVDNSLTTIATISGQFSGTTQIFEVPYPYWELWYSAQPAGEVGGQNQNVGSSTVTGPKESGNKGGGSSQTFIQGSFSVTFPSLKVQVMDAGDPNRIVRTIEPPGGLDATLWSSSNDPRPWVERFFEGQKKYYFVVNAHSLSSYNFQIRVPTKYIGKY